MSNFWFTAQRALFAKPIGVTVYSFKGSFSQFTHWLSGKKELRGGPKPMQPIDALYHTDTAGIIKASSLRTGSASDLHNIGYAPSPPSVVRRSIETCPNLEKATFVDIGCGKGLPLVVATEYPFSRIIGVELSPVLCETARENASRLAAAYPDRTPIEIVEGDASKFEFPSGYVLVYLNNPAYPRLVDCLADRIASHQAKGNKVIVIYCSPANAKLFDRRAAFSRYFAALVHFEEDETAASPLGNHAESVVIWQGVGQPMFEPHPGCEAAVHVTAGGGHGWVQP